MHKNFYKFQAKDNFELGVLMGEKFFDVAKRTVSEAIKESAWEIKIERAKKFLKFNQEYFPQYIDELQGYAKGANVNFLDLYTLSLEDEVNQDHLHEKCTTVITNGGKLLAHNEDWDKGSEDKICVVEKTIGDKTILELFYFNTLGGNSVSINSDGYIVAINSMISNDIGPPEGPGVSKNFVSRWFSESNNPDSDIAKLKNMPRSQGHNINILDINGALWNIEYTPNHLIDSRPESPFVHSNHYLSKLSRYEANTNKNGTFDRYKYAKENIRPQMNLEEITELGNDNSYGEKLSLMNERTIAKIIINLSKSEVRPPTNKAKIWLLRESELGFLDYKI